MGRALITLTNEVNRKQAIDWIVKAPPGTRVEFKAQKRTIPQNDRMWSLLTQISTQLEWYGHKLKPDDWKIMFMDALNGELYTVPDIYGIGTVNIGRRSSDLSVAEMSQLMELITQFAVEHKVKLADDPAEPQPIAKPKKVRTPEQIEARKAILAKARAAKGNRKPVHAKKPVEAIPLATEEITHQRASNGMSQAQYVEWARSMIKASGDKAADWFNSPDQDAMRREIGIDELTASLLGSIAAQTASGEK